MIKEIIKNAQTQKTLVGVRTNSQSWGESIIGFIVEIEETSFIINEIDEYGLYIGNTNIELDDVINVDVNDRYQKRLQFIHDHMSTFEINNRVTLWKEGQTLVPYFSQLLELKVIVTLYFSEDDYVTGIILKYDENQIMISNIGSEGDDDGTSCHNIDDLTGVRYNSLEEQKIKLLYENRSIFY